MRRLASNSKTHTASATTAFSPTAPRNNSTATISESNNVWVRHTLTFQNLASTSCNW